MLYEYGIAYKLNQFEQLQEMLISGNLEKLWKNKNFKNFLGEFKEFVL